jgi:hypothetical protein
MTDYTLTDKQVKRLMTFLGECDCGLNDRINSFDQDEVWRCSLCKLPVRVKRYFSTPQDAHDLAVKLVEVGRWNKFEDSTELPWLYDAGWGDDDLYQAGWLLTDPTRFCYLVNLYLEGKEK